MDRDAYQPALPPPSPNIETTIAIRRRASISHPTLVWVWIASLAECECLDGDLLKQPTCHLQGIAKGYGKPLHDSKMRTMQNASGFGDVASRMSPVIDVSRLVPEGCCEATD